MALLALLVALGGLTVSLLTYLRGRPARPIWDAKVTIRVQSDGERRVTARAENRGRGVAHDVTLTPRGAGLMEVFAQQKLDRVGFSQKLEVTMVYGPEVEGDGSFMLSWSEKPNLHRTQRKILKFSLKALSKPDSRRARRNS